MRICFTLQLLATSGLGMLPEMDSSSTPFHHETDEDDKNEYLLRRAQSLKRLSDEFYKLFGTKPRDDPPAPSALVRAAGELKKETDAMMARWDQEYKRQREEQIRIAAERKQAKLERAAALQKEKQERGASLYEAAESMNWKRATKESIIESLKGLGADEEDIASVLEKLRRTSVFPIRDTPVNDVIKERARVLRMRYESDPFMPVDILVKEFAEQGLTRAEAMEALIVP